jgi:hypothetical protein
MNRRYLEVIVSGLPMVSAACLFSVAMMFAIGAVSGSIGAYLSSAALAVGAVFLIFLVEIWVLVTFFEK